MGVIAGGRPLSTLGGMGWVNYEYADVSTMVRGAYARAGHEIREQGLALGAEGIIGVQLDPRAWRSESRLVFKMILAVAGDRYRRGPG
jgi:uncharacterized protein YbjQ (UPF0145 family)